MESSEATMTTFWSVHDLALEAVDDAWIAGIQDTFLDGFGLSVERAWSTDRLAYALENVSYLALAYAHEDATTQRFICGYAMYTIPQLSLPDGTYLLWEDAICLRKRFQQTGGARGLSASIAARSTHQPIGWMGGRTQNPRVIKRYRQLGHTFPFAEDYSTPVGQSIFTFLRNHVREVRDIA